MSWFEEGAGKQVPVEHVLDATTWELVVDVVTAGALVSIGRTSDGGALGVTVTLDGKWKREYFRDPEEAQEWLKDAALAVQALAEASHASSGRRKRQRGS